MAEELNGEPQEEEIEELEPQEVAQPSEDDEQLQDESQEQQPEEDKPDDDNGKDVDLFAMTDEEYDAFVANNTYPKSKNEQPEKLSETQEKTEEVSSKKTEKPSVKQPSQIDYKAFYDEVMRPFVANGKEVRLNQPSDVIRLMQMGAGYNKRMEQLKPIKKAAETLRKANIDEKTLSFLIDINNGDKEALKTLLKNKNIDPVELDMENVNYSPTIHSATDGEVEFSDIVREIEPSLGKINSILDRQWDSKSKAQLLENPELLKKLHQEIQLGRFDIVQEEVENQKALGNYADRTDLEAYIDVVTKAWYAQQAMIQQQNANKNKPNKEKQLKAREDKLKAAPVRNSITPKKTTITNQKMYEMSDEEFEKLTI